MTISLSGKSFVSSAAGAGVSTYRDEYLIVDDTAGAGELQGPIAKDTLITLPNGGTYEDIELEVRYNGQTLVPLIDYDYVGAGPSRTQIKILSELEGTREFPSTLEFMTTS